jgi:hypothetical protein
MKQNDIMWMKYFRIEAWAERLENKTVEPESGEDVDILY